MSSLTFLLLLHHCQHQVQRAREASYTVVMTGAQGNRTGMPANLSDPPLEVPRSDELTNLEGSCLMRVE